MTKTSTPAVFRSIFRPTSFAELVQIHKEDYRLHAEHLMAGVKSFTVEHRDEPRSHYNTNAKVVERVDVKLGIAAGDNAARQELCRKIKVGEPTPELDKVISSYVTLLTGRLPSGRKKRWTAKVTGKKAAV